MRQLLISFVLTLAPVQPALAQEVDELEALAERAGVNLIELKGALNTTGMAPLDYLYAMGHLQRPEPVYGIWDRLAECESTSRWHIDAYHDGGLQILPSTWDSYGGRQFARYAWQASRGEQIIIAQRIQHGQGWCAWPTCARRLQLVRFCP